MLWLFNFSSSWVGGGLVRTIETVKWFDNNCGACFIINDKIKSDISRYDKKNKYFFVSDNKINRIFFEGSYIPKIVEKIGKPDVYFSYGIPVFNNIGKINWFHISNALTLKTNKISLHLKTRIKMLILKKRIIKSIKFTHIVTGESEFSINLLKDEASKRNLKCHYDVLPNGYDKSLIKKTLNKEKNKIDKYAITVGTYKYKKIEIALKLFHQIREIKNLKKFVVVGQVNNLPLSILKDKFVEVKPKLPREDLFNLLYNSEYYISASQIENSSNAALEALFLTKNIILSNIPSHNEMLRNFKTKNIYLNNSKLSFISLENININEIDAVPWIDISKKLFHIINEFEQIPHFIEPKIK